MNPYHLKYDSSQSSEQGDNYDQITYAKKTLPASKSIDNMINKRKWDIK